MRDAEQSIARVSAELRALRQREREITRKLGGLQAQRDALAASIATQLAALQQDVREAWMLGRQPPLQRWLATDDPQQAARIARYYDYLQRDRADRLAAFHAEQARLATLETGLAGEQARLTAARDELAARERELRGTRDTRARLVASLATELRDRQKDLKRLQDDAARLQRLANTARTVFRDVPPEATGAPLAQRRGKLRWPASGRLAVPYGAPLAEGKLRTHGITIAAPEGSEVKAVHAGRVAYADWLRGYGLLVIVDHGDGFLSIYGHNQTLARQVGDWVKEGDTLAAVGNSGGQASAGLYFELRQNGQPQDPARWLR